MRVIRRAIKDLQSWGFLKEARLMLHLPTESAKKIQSVDYDLQLNFHPATVRASAVDAPCGAV
jgi:hypothetical protein